MKINVLNVISNTLIRISVRTAIFCTAYFLKNAFNTMSKSNIVQLLELQKRKIADKKT